MYNKIVNPVTKKKVSIYSKSGIKILKKYLKYYNLYGGATLAPRKDASHKGDIHKDDIHTDGTVKLQNIDLNCNDIIDSEIGKGAAKIVYKTKNCDNAIWETHNISPTKCQNSVVKKSKSRNPKHIQAIKSELDFENKLFPNELYLAGTCNDDGNKYIISKKYTRDLYSLLFYWFTIFATIEKISNTDIHRFSEFNLFYPNPNPNPKNPENPKYIIYRSFVNCIKKLLSDLKSMHDKNLIHLDIKPHNILVNTNIKNKYEIVDSRLTDYDVSINLIDPLYNNHHKLTKGTVPYMFLAQKYKYSETRAMYYKAQLVEFYKVNDPDKLASGMEGINTVISRFHNNKSLDNMVTLLEERYPGSKFDISGVNTNIYKFGPRNDIYSLGVNLYLILIVPFYRILGNKMYKLLDEFYPSNTIETRLNSLIGIGPGKITVEDYIILNNTLMSELHEKFIEISRNANKIENLNDSSIYFFKNCINMHKNTRFATYIKTIPEKKRITNTFESKKNEEVKLDLSRIALIEAEIKSIQAKIEETEETEDNSKLTLVISDLNSQITVIKTQLVNSITIKQTNLNKELKALSGGYTIPITDEKLTTIIELLGINFGKISKYSPIIYKRLNLNNNREDPLYLHKINLRILLYKMLAFPIFNSDNLVDNRYETIQQIIDDGRVGRM